MPATVISLTNFRKYARNRGNAGKNGAGWNCDVYEVQKTCWWLYAVEYANFNCQLAYNAEPTSEGYKQGGPVHGMNMNADNLEDFMERTAFETRIFERRMYLYPIPLNEIQKSSKLVQNPGW